MEICRLEDANKAYHMGEKVYPLKGINISVNAGEFISIEGSSGIGKSTLLYVMGSLLKLDGGKLYLDNQDVSRLTDKQLTSLRSEKLGFIFQETNLIQALTVKENLEFTKDLGKRAKGGTQEIEALLERLGLSDRKDYLPHRLSGGQRRRAMIARALINAPALILADEPTNDLEDLWAQEIIKLFEEAAGNGSAVVMVTHNGKWSGKAAVQYRLENGKLIILPRGSLNEKKFVKDCPND